MSQLRIAVVGVGAQSGSRARQYIGVLSRLTDHYAITALCDRDPGLLAEVTVRHPTVARYSSARGLLDSGCCDVVLAMAPKDAHVALAMSAARRRLHIITEIPVALTRRYARAVSAACVENGVKWETAEQVWLWPKEQVKRDVVAAGGIGRITHSRLCYQTGQYHGFSAIRFLLASDARRVLGYCGEVETEPYLAYGGESETRLKWDSGVVEFGSGVVCLFEKPPRVFPSYRRGVPAGWQVEGTAGFWDRDRLTLYRGERDQTFDIREEYETRDGVRTLLRTSIDTDPPVVHENPYSRYGIGTPDDVSKASILVGFHAAVTTGAAPRYGVENGLRDWEICLAIRESARRGSQWVDLPLDSPTELENRIEEAYLRRYGKDPLEDPDGLIDGPFTRSGVLWETAHWL